MPYLDGSWDAGAFFEHLTLTNRLARREGFTFGRVSGLNGLEDMLHEAQSSPAFVAVSDSADGSIDLNNTPRTARVKTVFLAMRHASEDMEARTEALSILRELFRQFLTRLIPEKTRLQQKSIYLENKIQFCEIEPYFFTGCACAYFHIGVTCHTDLRLNPDEWEE